jgi:hypothetical protein
MAGQKPGKMLELAMSTIPCAKTNVRLDENLISGIIKLTSLKI